MLGDYLTKPLQGPLFIQIREKILSLPGSTRTSVHRSVFSAKSDERVNMKGKTNNEWMEYGKKTSGEYCLTGPNQNLTGLN